MANVEEYEEEVPVKDAKLIGSEEFVEAAQAVQSDVYDHESWSIMCEEVSGGRGGSATVRDTYDKFLEHFPRCSKVYGDLASWYEKKGSDDDLLEAEKILDGRVDTVRSVDLWKQYLKIVHKRRTTKTGDKVKFDDPDSRRQVEVEFERCIQNIGWAHNSHELWKMYINFIRSWPDGSSIDPEKKRTALRSVYQRAIAVPMADLGSIWDEYQEFEISIGEHQAKEVLPVHEQKSLSSTSLYSTREKLTRRIDYNRFSTPPSKSSREMEQLELWNRYIRYESTNPSNLNAAQLNELISLVYEQCLCCFGRNVEIWLAYAKTLDNAIQSLSDADYSASNKAEEDTGGVSKDHQMIPSNALTSEGIHGRVRWAYEQAMQLIPSSAFLHTAYAEYEEANGHNQKALEIYKRAFDTIPCGFTFHSYQSHLRRNKGILAAREAFSETLKDRSEKSFGFDIYLVHARLELDANSAADVAIKVLELCRQAHPQACDSVKYMRVLVDALKIQGNINRIRWAFACVLGHGGSEEVPLFKTTLNDESSGNINSSTTSHSGDLTSTSGAVLSLADQLALWNAYLEAEICLNSCSIARLNQIRDCRDRCLLALEDKIASMGAASSTTTSAFGIDIPKKVPSLFDVPAEIFARHSSHSHGPLPDVDNSAFDRSRGRSAIGENSRNSQLSNSSSDMHGSSIPTVLTNLISRLPPSASTQGQQMPDVDAFLRQLKSITLPPRPLVETEAENIPISGQKRAADWLAAGKSGSEKGYDDIDYEENEETTARDDVFRQRQRARRS